MGKPTTIAATLGVIAVAVMGYLAIPKTPPPVDVFYRDPHKLTISGEIVVLKMRGGKVESADTVQNSLVAVGIRQLWRLFTGDSSSHYDTAAFLCVGDSSRTTDTTMTALLGGNVAWKNVDSVTYGANFVKYWAGFASGVANFRWSEEALFNDSAKIMLDRAADSLGTKTTADTWILSIKLTAN